MDLELVLVVPSLSSNLISVSQITEALHYYVIFWPNDCVFEDMVAHQILVYGTRKGRFYDLEENLRRKAFHTGIREANKSVAMLWHRSLGHLSSSYFKKLKPNLFLNFVESEFKYDICELAKKKKHKNFLCP